MKQLLPYQETAVNKLITRSLMFLNEEGRETIVLQAPTGAGKTFMATKFMEELIKETNEDICYIWISLGKGELHKQSMKAVKREISNEMQCSLLENEFFGSRSVINQNEIVFASWQKIKLKNADGTWKALVMRDQEQFNFIEVLENTRNINRKIILIIDESHAGAGTEASYEIIDTIIKPDLQIDMSATPITRSNDTKIIVDPNDVINAGIIKKEILINYDIDQIPDEDIDSQKLVLKAASQKRELLKRKYEEQKSNVNPLVLIQLPNSNAGEDLRIEIENYLREIDVTEENGKLAKYCNEKLLKNDAPVDYLIFKQAIDTGWDCPRAQILVKFRETNSIVFEIQTVGRILRMPEAKHYMSDELNTAYVYTNIKSIEVQKETYNPNIIKSIMSVRKDIYKPLKLKSFYRNRIDYGDVTSSYTHSFCHSFCDFFSIPEYEIKQDFYENMEKLKKMGINEDFEKMDTIIKNGIIESETIDSIINERIEGDTLSVGISDNDLQYSFEEIIKNNLNGLQEEAYPQLKAQYSLQ